MSLCNLHGHSDPADQGNLWANHLAAMPTDHDLTVIIPAHNESQRLPWTLTQLAAFFSAGNIDFRVLVVDDGSRDCTAELTRRFGPRFSTIRLFPQGGKGRAVRTAMLRATGRVLCFTDADLPFELSALRQGCQWIDDGLCDVVFGARDIDGSRHQASRRLARRLATFAFREVVRRLVSHEVTDTQCGLKLFRRRAAWEIFARSTIDGFAFDTEVVLLTHRLGLSFRRIPVTLVNEFSSTLSLRRHAIPMLLDVLRLRWRLSSHQNVPPPHQVALLKEDSSDDDHRKAAA
ncbi:MAG: glycosyltransferase [Planctomycetaceae bacterium]|nr:glycosyltransferase [Planctomycetaceae bacterium]